MNLKRKIYKGKWKFKKMKQIKKKNGKISSKPKQLTLKVNLVRLLMFNYFLQIRKLKKGLGM